MTMLLQDDQNYECPLCMEPFEMDDFNFYPCTCGYQICRFCWHRIRTDENELCPACRKQYPENPADFKPISPDEWQKIKSEKRLKDQQKKQKMSESRKHLPNVRVVQKNLVFVVGLPTRLADAEVLKKYNYFGKFGKIHKVVVNQSTSYAGSQGPSASAYVTYCRPEDALQAIKSVNNIQVDSRTLKASLGTTKYCSHFLKNQLCPKTDCMYLHELGDEAASFTKEDMQQGKHQEYEKKLQDLILGSNNNSRKQTVSPVPPNNPSNPAKDTWPCTVRTGRSKEQSQRTEGKSSRSKNKHSSEGQKSKKNKSKTSEANKSSPKEEGQRKKSKHPKETSGQPAVQRLEAPRAPKADNAQTTYVHIAEQPRSESPLLPPSPISSSSSSLFTPFGSLSSNFLSSSSPSPPPAPPTENSLFSNYNGQLHNEEQLTTDSTDWNSNYSFGDSQKQLPEDDLDFDPWNESSKGLADLMAKEANPSYMEAGFFQPTSQQRIAVPPPGFSSRQQCNHLPGIYSPANTDYLPSKLSSYRDGRATLNNCPQFYQDVPHLGMYKQQFQQQNSVRENLIDNLRLKKNWDERFRNIFPDMLYCLNSRGVQKTQNQSGPMWNQPRDLSWLSNETSVLNSSNITDGQRASPQIWMKALQQLTLEENAPQFTGHSPYANPFALRGQCPPPGFVAPSRSPAFQQVNQKI